VSFKDDPVFEPERWFRDLMNLSSEAISRVSDDLEIAIAEQVSIQRGSENMFDTLWDAQDRQYDSAIKNEVLPKIFSAQIKLAELQYKLALTDLAEAKKRAIEE